MNYSGLTFLSGKGYSQYPRALSADIALVYVEEVTLKINVVHIYITGHVNKLGKSHEYIVEFSIPVSTHQGTVLNSLLFTIIPKP